MHSNEDCSSGDEKMGSSRASARQSAQLKVLLSAPRAGARARRARRAPRRARLPRR
jgi:hypothetical protein